MTRVRSRDASVPRWYQGPDAAPRRALKSLTGDLVTGLFTQFGEGQASSKLFTYYSCDLAACLCIVVVAFGMHCCEYAAISAAFRQSPRTNSRFAYKYNDPIMETFHYSHHSRQDSSKHS